MTKVSGDGGRRRRVHSVSPRCGFCLYPRCCVCWSRMRRASGAVFARKMEWTRGGTSLVYPRAPSPCQRLSGHGSRPPGLTVYVCCRAYVGTLRNPACASQWCSPSRSLCRCACWSFAEIICSVRNSYDVLQERLPHDIRSARKAGSGSWKPESEVRAKGPPGTAPPPPSSL